MDSYSRFVTELKHKTSCTHRCESKKAIQLSQKHLMQVLNFILFFLTFFLKKNPSCAYVIPFRRHVGMLPVMQGNHPQNIQYTAWQERKERQSFSRTLNLSQEDDRT